MTDKVLEFVRQKSLIQAGDRIVAGFSGGADSVCLLLVLKELQKVYDFSLRAVHVEHGIRGEESLRDAEFAREFCRSQGIELDVYSVDAPAWASEEGKSLEEAARELRYECFEKSRREWKGNKIAVAHHADDNAETVLFHMCRGTGIRGMRGIQPIRDQIIRPLLCVTRREIETCLRDAGADYCTDSTNEEIAYSRNRIRKNVIPQLEQINKQGVGHIARLAENMEEICEYLDETAWKSGISGAHFYYEEEKAQQNNDYREKDRMGQGRYAAVTAPEEDRRDGQIPVSIRIDKKVFAGLHPVLQKHFLYQIIAVASGNRKDITSTHVENLRRLFEGQTGKCVDLPYGLWAIAEYDEVCILQKKLQRDTREDLILRIDGQTLLPDGLSIHTKVLEFSGNCEKIPEKSYTKWFDYDKIIDTVLVRKRQSGDYLTITSEGNTKKLKDYFINEKVPQMDRDRIWLLADGSHIMWVIGYRMSAAYKVTPQTRRILEVRVDKGEKDYERINTCDVHGGTGQ